MTRTHTMPSADAAWYRMDRPTNHMVINSVLTFDAPLTFDDLREVVRERIVAPFPRYRQLVHTGPLGTLQWVDDEHFDLDLHLHHLALPAPGDQAALQTLVADLMAGGLDPARPLWDMYLVDGYDEGCALICRMHHCIADGIALGRVMLEMTDVATEAGQDLAPPSRPSHRPPIGPVDAPLHLAADLAHESVTTLLHPGRLVAAGREAVADGRALVELLTSSADQRTSLKQGEHGIAQRVAWTPPLPLDDIKAIAHATHTTVNDVLIAALTGALTRYLHARDEFADDLHALVPFNIRPLDEPLPADLGNKFGLIVLALPTQARTPADRLAEVHARMQAIKASRQPQMSYAILEVMGRVPSAVEGALIDVFTAKGTAVVTNVPGPREVVTLAGVPVSAVLVWAPCSGSVGMSVSMFSYRDTVTVGFMTHALLVDDPGVLVDELLAELGALDRL